MKNLKWPNEVEKISQLTTLEWVVAMGMVGLGISIGIFAYLAARLS